MKILISAKFMRKKANISTKKNFIESLLVSEKIFKLAAEIPNCRQHNINFKDRKYIQIMLNPNLILFFNIYRKTFPFFLRKTTIDVFERIVCTVHVNLFKSILIQNPNSVEFLRIKQARRDN